MSFQEAATSFLNDPMFSDEAIARIREDLARSKNEPLFSAEDRVRLEKRYEGIRLRIKNTVEDSSWLPSYEECPHIWRRLYQLAGMSREEMMNEIEADYVLFD